MDMTAPLDVSPAKSKISLCIHSDLSEHSLDSQGLEVSITWRRSWMSLSIGT